MDISKYASLPGIDTQSADVYETTDLPEDDQAIHRAGGDAQSTDGSVERITVSFSDAQAKFKGKLLDENRDAFTAGLGFFPRSEYEILMDSDKLSETPTQKYDRLKTEVSDFVSALEGTDSSSALPNSDVMRENAKGLLQQLQNIQLDKIIKSEELVLDPDNSLSKRLTSEIATALAQKKTDSDKAKVDDEKVCYELYVPTAVEDKSPRVIELEKRLARLEKTVGLVSGQETGSLGSSPNLVSAIEALEAKVSTLDKTNIDLVEARLQSLLDKLKEVKSKPQLPSEKLTKVGELLEVVTKWDSVVDTIPQVVDRLAVLESLHQQTLQFSQALNSLDAVQQQIHTSSKGNTASLDQLNVAMNNNLTSIQNSISSLEKRIQNLSA